MMAEGAPGDGPPRATTTGEAEEAEAGFDCGTLEGIIRTISTLQYERQETYRLFAEGFETYLKSAPHYNFEVYKYLVNEITKTFVGISGSMADMRERLCGEQGRADLGELVDLIQAAEKERLAVTAKFQTARQREVDEELDLADDLRVLKRRLQVLSQQAADQVQALKFEL